MYKFNRISLTLMLCFSCSAGFTLFSQQNYSGFVYSEVNGKPLDMAEIQVVGTSFITHTNSQGYFYLNTAEIDSLLNNSQKVIFSYIDRQISWSSPFPISVFLYDVRGRNAGGFNYGSVNEGRFVFPNLSSGSYFLRLSSTRSEKVAKVQVIENKILLNTRELGLKESVQIKITRNGYKEKIFFLKQGIYNPYYLETGNSKLHDYLLQIPDLNTFQEYEGKPLNDTYNGVTSVKFLYDLTSGKIFYINADKYAYHYEFASEVLEYKKGQYFFNREQYTHNPQRIYFLGSINHYLSSNTFTVEFFAADELTCSEIQTVYTKIAGTCFFSNDLKFFPNTLSWESCTSMPIIKSEELFNGQDYQALNPGIAFGYLKKIDWTDVSSSYLGRHDIALINGIPNDVPVVAGIITTQFQTPLSHINILSKNRKTPNMALRSGWDDELLSSLNGKLVKLEVAGTYYAVREAIIQEAETYWKSHEPINPVKLVRDTLTSGLVDLQTAGFTSTRTIGGKASNFAELRKISTVPVPEGSFAIPFYYYEQHLKQHGLLNLIQNMLKDPGFLQDARIREEKLKMLRDTIRKCAVDPVLINMVTQKLAESGFAAYRFRSSTNAEDVEGFNGAGLYDSYTGIPGDFDKSIEKAIRKVWASLWNFRAFEEREYYKIDHFTVAMGILVHRSFPTEDVNGVVITENLYNRDLPAYTINSQFLEYSVVRPEQDILPEQVLYYTMEEPYLNRIEYISKSNLPDRTTEFVLTTQEITSLANICKAIETHYCNQLQKCISLDIEFKIDSSVSGSRNIYIKQVRPFQN